ncbi:hypothetical protein D8682_00755 (plasmid) [Buttiauxella sp. 3AFRM03]|uniref:hypothetical protein n=1 Tax=Buttiauxella sp. 3AFRM03 TaxID=2479367 RepID=UPI000EF8223F|nr:hypothetical protein [Buttiauxella sp. 3AFRM03]AYN25526.1 hypothetical protein D8682_00130 [Buttiauxella sp. 3AFRM03]AYN25637.1 hypothetical protein D8682_00755 [Buttiauxella sp. 3AFRM03]
MIEARNSVAVSVFSKNGVKALYFSGIPKLSGHKGTLNFPYDETASLFVQVEKIMQANNMCHNVTRVEPMRQNETESVYSVTYNRPLLKSAVRK